MNEKSILIVDDDENIRLSYKYFLENEGYKIFTASNISEAILQVENNKIDVSLLDLRMDGEGDGLVLNKQLKEIDSTIQNILITAYTDFGTAVIALKEGAFDYISKTVPNSELLEKIKNAIKKKESLTFQEDVMIMNQISLSLMCSHSMTLKGFNFFCKNNNEFFIENYCKSHAEFSLKRKEIDSNILLICSDCILEKSGDKNLTIKKIQLTAPNSKLLIINHKLSIDEMSDLLLLGVSGFIPLDVEDTILIDAFNKIVKGEIWAQRDVMSKTLNAFRDKKSLDTIEIREILTRREREVLRFVALDYQNKEIAGKLCISERTVKSHLYNIYEKLDVKNRDEAVTVALSKKIIN